MVLLPPRRTLKGCCLHSSMLLLLLMLLLQLLLDLTTHTADAFWAPSSSSLPLPFRCRALPQAPQQQQPWPFPSSRSGPLRATQQGGSSGSGWRGGPRPDEDAVDLSGDGGVTKRVIRPGFGYKQESPPPHAYCKVAFVMKTATGQVIADRMKQPMEFMLGLERPEVIPGWELAVATMKPNEIAEVVCSPEYAFGAAEGYEDKIPPGATIITRLQLLDWRSLKGAGSTDVEDTHDLTKKWREEIDKGTSPMTEWAAPPKANKKTPKAQAQDVEDMSKGPLADAQAAMEKQQRQQQEQDSSSSSSSSSSSPPTPPGSSEVEGFSQASMPRVEAMPEDANKPRVDITDPAAPQNPNQVVIGTAPQYKWKERQSYLELVVPVPETVQKKDVLVHLTNRVCMVGFKTPEGKESWVVGGDLFGPIELEASFWVLSKDFSDELTEGKACIEVRLEKKEPMRRIWSTVFKDQ